MKTQSMAQTHPSFPPTEQNKQHYRAINKARRILNHPQTSLDRRIEMRAEIGRRTQLIMRGK